MTEPIKRVMPWKGIPIGITHDAGDKRHRRSLTAGYGHIRGSYGDAEDGMSIDVYLGPDLGSDQIFRVKQIRPDTGDLDEYKYIIGCHTLKGARELYLANMPKRFFGGCETVDFDTLKQYQKRDLMKAGTVVAIASHLYLWNGRWLRKIA